MISVLLVENKTPDFQLIKNALRAMPDEDFKLRRVKRVNVQVLKNDRFDVILFSQGDDLEESLAILSKITALKLEQPIIYLANNLQKDVDLQVMSFGADSYLVKTELTAINLSRAIKHAIVRKRNEAHYAYFSTHDPLTGLANRYLLFEHLSRTLRIAKRAQSHFALMLVDINNFKLINDSLGHDFGDLLLIQFADRLATSIRDTDIVARFGNDEFAVLLEDSGCCRDMASIAIKIQRQMSGSFVIKHDEIEVTTSVGVASYPECGVTPEMLLKNTASALYKAKDSGRNQFHFYTSDLNEQAKIKLEMEKNLRKALVNREFEVFLQPQINPNTNLVYGAEALLRWHHPEQGYISPAIFIPLLDELAMLPGIEGWVLDEVCHFSKKITDSHGELKLSVNISGNHFKSGKLKEHVFLALQSSSLDARFLEIELTEDIMIEHVEGNIRVLNELKALGVSIALDDFGKGYSSLSYLKNFPADILKIDKAFIDFIAIDSRDAAIVEAMIALSHRLDIKVVAEGVEEINQLNQLQNYACDLIQGYYFAKPMPMLDFEQFLVAQKHDRCSGLSQGLLGRG